MTRLLAAAAAAFLLLPGCSGGPTQVPVTGDVTLDGKPFGDGNDARIRFEPTAAAGNSFEAFIKDGKYEAKLSPASYKVSIIWNKATGKKQKGALAGPGEDGETVESMIPAKYNDATELKADVAAGKTKHDFALASAGKK